MILRTSARVALLGAVLLAPAWSVSVAAAQGAAVDTANEEQKRTAQRNFENGMKAQKKGQHEAAYTAFKASYEAVASPNSHLMLARALVELGRLEEAYVEYESTLEEAQSAAASDKKYEQTAQASKTELADVRSKLALLTVQVTGAGDGDRLTVRGREIPRSQWGKPIPVMPGSVRVELTTASGQEAVEEVNAEAGGSPSVTLAPPAAGSSSVSSEGGGAEGSAEAELDTGSTSMRTWAYVAGGVGVAGLITFGVFGALNNSKHGKLEDECPGGVCPKELEDDADTGRTYQTIANVGLGVGIVGIAAGTVLFLLSGSEEKTARRSSTQAASAPRLNLHVGPRAVSVQGSF
jgi:hypothetical protein